MSTPANPRTVILRPAGPPPTCMNCPARQLCLPAGMDDEACASVDRLVDRRQQLQRGDVVYQMNEPVRDKVYAIRAGTIKSFQLFADGVQRIIGFPGVGDLLGLETIGMTEHTGVAIALTDSTLCELSYTRLGAAARQSPVLARQFEAVLSKDLARQQAGTLVLSYSHADQKLANFLLSWAWNSAQRGGSPTSLQLPMTRQDIGDYLGLTDATISRLLRQLQRRGCITVRQRQLDIVDQALLRAIAAGQQPQPMPLPPATGGGGESYPKTAVA